VAVRLPWPAQALPAVDQALPPGPVRLSGTVQEPAARREARPEGLVAQALPFAEMPWFGPSKPRPMPMCPQGSFASSASSSLTRSRATNIAPISRDIKT
jgi:hypothetical protein